MTNHEYFYWILDLGLIHQIDYSFNWLTGCNIKLAMWHWLIDKLKMPRNTKFNSPRPPCRYSTILFTKHLFRILSGDWFYPSWKMKNFASSTRAPFGRLRLHHWSSFVFLIVHVLRYFGLKTTLFYRLQLSITKSSVPKLRITFWLNLRSCTAFCTSIFSLSIAWTKLEPSWFLRRVFYFSSVWKNRSLANCIPKLR